MELVYIPPLPEMSRSLTLRAKKMAINYYKLLDEALAEFLIQCCIRDDDVLEDQLP